MSYDTQINEYKYKYPSATGAQGNTEATSGNAKAELNNEAVLDTAFTSDAEVKETSIDAKTTSGDLFAAADTTSGDTYTTSTGITNASEKDAIYTVDKNADVETLEAQQEAVNTRVEEATTTQTNVGSELERYTNIIAVQDKRIETLTEKIDELEESTQKLETENKGINRTIDYYDGEIARLDNLIQANSGFLGTISNGVNSFFGKGVNIEALKTQKANYEDKKAEAEEKLKENNETISDNNNEIKSKTLMKETTEGFKAKNEEHAEALEEELKELEEKIQNGTATLEEIEAAIKAANKKTGVQASDEDVRKAALTIAAAGSSQEEAEPGIGIETETGLKPEEDGLGTAEGISVPISNFLNSADENGNLDDNILTDTLVEEGGMSKEEAAEKMEVIETIATYEEIGVSLDAVDVATMTVSELNSVTETAIIQEVIKSTSTKVIGGAKTITSKKEMDAQADARDDFIASNNALNGYYSANDVNDFEVQSFLKLSDNMVSNINQGYVYDTSALQQMTNNADSLLSTLMTKVSATEGVGSSAETQFMQEKTKTEDTLSNVEKSLGNDADNNDKFADCKVEFLNLTSGFNNAESDSEQISYIKLMKELGKKGERIKDNPDSQNPYLDGSLWTAA